MTILVWWCLPVGVYRTPVFLQVLSPVVWDLVCHRVFEGHTSWINDAALLRGGSQAVTVSGDSTARLWDTRTQECVQVLQGHSDDVTCLVLTSRGRFVVTGSVDGTAQVWDLAAQDVACVDVHDGKVRLDGCCFVACIQAEQHAIMVFMQDISWHASYCQHILYHPASWLLSS
eukprot:GHRR01034527.1.p1 GENE.GHRR01034527.1~~GHRR01034527.1.p1  ORF type:complete len:173 (+),score=34.05 GHRR01034527.1:167-685(+)